MVIVVGFGAVRARRVNPGEATTAIGDVDYVDAFEVAVGERQTRSGEQWARAVFEDSPVVVRMLLVLGWRLVLGLRLGPRGSAEHVLGWRITARTPDEITLVLTGPWLIARLAIGMQRARLRQTTMVSFRRWPARPLWSMAGLAHRRLVPYVLNRAARDADLATT